MGFKGSRWFRIVVALLIGSVLEMAVLFGVYAISPQSRVEPASPKWQLVEWVHEPSWHITVGMALLVPAFFEDLGRSFLVVVGLQTTLYGAVVYLLIEHIARKRIFLP